MFRAGIAVLCTFVGVAAIERPYAEVADQIARDLEESAAADQVVLARTVADAHLASALRHVESILVGHYDSLLLSKAEDVLRDFRGQIDIASMSSSGVSALAAAESLLAATRNDRRSLDSLHEQVHHAATHKVAEQVRANVIAVAGRLIQARRVRDAADSNVRSLELGLAKSH